MKGLCEFVILLMMIKNNTTLKGNKVKVTFGNGSSREVEVFNVTCKAGLAEMLSRLLDTENTDKLSLLQYLACGTGSTAQTENDTSLEVETSRVLIDYDLCVQNETELKIYATFPIGDELTIRELGLFVGVAANVLLARTVLPGDIIKSSDESMTIEWKLNLNSA